MKDGHVNSFFPSFISRGFPQGKTNPVFQLSGSFRLLAFQCSEIH